MELSTERCSMMIMDEYVAEDNANMKVSNGGGDTPKLRRNMSRAQAPHLPPIREGSLSIQRVNDVDSFDSTPLPETGKSSIVRKSSAID